MVKDENAIEVVRTVAAPVEQVYEAWTNPEHLQQWFAPRGSAVRSADVALHQGGEYRVEMIDSDWNRHVTDGRYEELVPNRSIVKTLAHDGAGGRAGVGPTRVDVKFRDIGAGNTELTLLHENLVDEDHKADMRREWSQRLDKLDVLLARSRV
ncbi:MAG TPA: SRPBCC domain-containing protein [Candidatus Eisenbacteria bacterium]|nr:SRPBCC domain-containing protein [Candidatus Eisenbacteria bacterium]